MAICSRLALRLLSGFSILKHILFIEFWNCSPHLETALELAKRHIDGGDQVSFYFCGHDTPFINGISVHPEDCGLFRKLPEVRGVELINSTRLHFHPRVTLPKVNVSIPTYFESLNDLINFKYKTFQAGIGVASSLVSDTQNSRPDLKIHHDRIIPMITSSVSVYEFTKSVLESTKADLIYIFNGRFCNHRAVMCAAQEHGIEILYHERGANKFHYNVMPAVPHDLSYLQQRIKSRWDEFGKDPAARELATAYFTDLRKGVVHGWVSYTGNQRKNALPAIDPTRRIISYFSSSEDEYVSVGDLIKFTGWNSQFDAVNDLIQICQGDSRLQLFIRLHPHKRYKSAEDQNRWLALAEHENVTVISFDSDVDSYALIETSDVVITAGSTVGLEATLLGRPSIAVGPSAYSELGVTYLPNSKKELEKLLFSELKPLPIEGVLAYGHYMMTFGTKFKHFEPETLFKGKFLGVDLHEMPLNRKRWLRFKNLLFKPLRALKKVLGVNQSR